MDPTTFLSGKFRGEAFDVAFVPKGWSASVSSIKSSSSERTLSIINQFGEHRQTYVWLLPIASLMMVATRSGFISAKSAIKTANRHYSLWIFVSFKPVERRRRMSKWRAFRGLEFSHRVTALAGVCRCAVDPDHFVDVIQAILNLLRYGRVLPLFLYQRCPVESPLLSGAQYKPLKICRERIFGTPFWIANILKPKLVCICVILKRLFKKITLAEALGGPQSGEPLHGLIHHVQL